MYRKILVALENSRADQSLLPHVTELAKRLGSELLLVHVADGWAARNIRELDLRESEEMRSDREYIEAIADSLEKEGFEAEAILAGGDPAKEIADCAQRENCDLIAMTTHGHRGLSDVIRGSVASELRHITRVPILMVRAKPGTSPPAPRPAS